MFLRRFTCAAREAVRTGSHTLAVHTAPLFPQATPEQYPYCAPWALPWNFRRRNLLRELVNYRADVMCLQEVQADHFENFLEPELAKFNYAGLHKCKTREFMGQYGKMDGCAMLYRRDKLTLVPGAGHDVEFNTIARSRHGNDKRLLNRLLRDNVAQASSGSLVGGSGRAWASILHHSPLPLHSTLSASLSSTPSPSPPPPPSSLAPNPSPPPHPPPFRAPFCSFIALPGWPAQVVFLEMTSTGQPHPAARRQLCIANTHINASPEFADVKLWQTQHLLIEIERLLTQATGSTSAIPMVLAGDFNSLPGSDPHTLLANGGIQVAEDPYGLLSTLPLRHSLPLRSALATVGAHVNASAESHELQKMEPPWTNYTVHFVGTLDYMWYTYDRLSVGGLLEMADERLVQEHTALPSPIFSSDHVPLLSEFHFKR